MKRIIVLLLVAAIVAIAVTGLVAWTGATGSGPVYAVGQVQAGLQRQPGHWVGRVVRVRGVVATAAIAPSCTVEGCPVTNYALLASRQLLLLPDPAPAGAAPHAGGVVAFDPNSGLLLAPGPADSWLAALRRVPLLSALLPNRQRIQQNNQPATYRVRVRTAAGLSIFCPRAPCYEAVLLDSAAPGAR